MSKFVVSGVYEVDPKNVRYDPKISTFNPRKPEHEYRGLLEQIRRSGQTTPGFVRNGLLGDGVHRTKACAELGIKMKVVDIDPLITDKEYILLCNENTLAARNDSTTQLAIKGLQLVELFNYSDAEVVQVLGMKDRRTIGFARTVRDSKYNKVYNVIEALKAGNAVSIEGKFTKSLEVAKKLIGQFEEREALADVVKTIDGELNIDYNEQINTETARVKFWEFTKKSPAEQKLEHIKYLNYVYRIDNV